MAKVSEIEKELAAEIRMQKNIGQQAKYRKRGSRSKKCSLPSDHYTKKQLKGLSGECMTYNLNKPMKWAEFKYMPVDLQAEYLKKLNTEHGATMKCAAEMLGICYNTLYQYMSRHGMNGVFPRTGGDISEDKKARWKAFLNGEEDTEPAEQTLEQPAEKNCDATPVHAEPPAESSAEATEQQNPEEKAAAPIEQPKQPRMKCQTTFTMRCTGPFNIYDFIYELGKFIDDGQPVDIILTGTINPD